MRTKANRPIYRSRWWMPGFSVSLGLIMLAAFWIGGPGRDERWGMIDLHATALTGLVLVTVIIGAWLVEVARGEDGSPYSALGAVGGIAYIVLVAVLRRRA